jgi:thiamine pyrophosphate-dependent acetolactate synthase large subunit-like protein
VGSGARLAAIAEATGGAEAYQVSDRQKLKETLRQALETVRRGRCAVVDVAITRVSAQVLS